MLFALCILTQLFNINHRHAYFSINVLIRFLTSSTYFKTHGFINRKKICTSRFVRYVSHAVIKIMGFYKVSKYKMLSF